VSAIAGDGRLRHHDGQEYASHALLATGDRDTAAAVLARAAAITGRLGARPLDSEVKALARRARLDLTTRRRHGSGGRLADARRAAGSHPP
jgi:hypothetical protein